MSKFLATLISFGFDLDSRAYVSSTPRFIRRTMVSVVFIAVLPGSASATAILDQAYDAFASCISGTTCPGYLVGGTSNSTLGQTFTAGQSGLLTEIGVQIIGSSHFQPITGPVTVELRQTLSGPSLASGTIAIASIPSTVDFAFVDVSSFGVFVNPGDSLAIVVSSTNTSNNIGWQNVSTSNPALLFNQYGGGAAFFFSSSSNSWVDVSPSAVAADFGFQTFVDPASTPEPSSVLLLSAAALALVGSASHRKS